MEQINEQWVRELVLAALEIVDPDEQRIYAQAKDETCDRIYLDVSDDAEDHQFIITVNVERL